MNERIKLCKNCRFFLANSPTFEKCGHPVAVKMNLVTGHNDRRYCDAMRSHLECGKDAKLFEQLDTYDMGKPF